MNGKDIWSLAREFEDEVSTLAQNLADKCADAIDQKDKQVLRLEDEISGLQEDIERTKEYVAKLEEREYRALKVDHKIDQLKEASLRPAWERDVALGGGAK